MANKSAYLGSGGYTAAGPHGCNSMGGGKGYAPGGNGSTFLEQLGQPFLVIVWGVAVLFCSTVLYLVSSLCVWTFENCRSLKSTLKGKETISPATYESRIVRVSGAPTHAKVSPVEAEDSSGSKSKLPTPIEAPATGQTSSTSKGYECHACGEHFVQAREDNFVCSKAVCQARLCPSCGVERVVSTAAGT